MSTLVPTTPTKPTSAKSATTATMIQLTSSIMNPTLGTRGGVSQGNRSTRGAELRDQVGERRAGLTTLVATTAGGSQTVPVLDVPEEEAVRLAHAALPDLVAQFRA